MQFRWEKDWPALFNLLQVFPECLSTFLLLHVAVLNPFGDIGPTSSSTCRCSPTCSCSSPPGSSTWLSANGPMKIFFIRWRFYGGRLV